MAFPEDDAPPALEDPFEETASPVPHEAMPGGADAQGQVTLVRDFFNRLNKSLKTIGLHRHATQKYQEFLKPAYQSLSDFLDIYGKLGLSVDQTAFKFQDVVIHEEEASEHNMAFRLYRDRIRMLVFEKGLTERELLDFVLVCTTQVKPGDPFGEDMASLLWKADFKHINYVVVESFALGDETEEQSTEEIDKVVAYMIERLSGTGKESFQFARLSLEDLDLVVENVEKASTVTIEGDTAREREQFRVRRELEQDERGLVLFRMVDALIALFQEEIDEQLGATLEEAFLQLLDSFLFMENFDGLDRIFVVFRVLEQQGMPAANAPWAKRIFRRLVDRMAEEPSIQKMAEMLETTGDKEIHERVKKYLFHLKGKPVLSLLQALERLNQPEARHVLCDALVIHGREDLDLFISRLHSKKANLVRDMLYLLDRFDPPDKLKHIAGLLGHPNLAIRMEALKTIGNTEAPEVAGYLVDALDDKDAQVRMTAAKLLARRDKSLALSKLLPVVQKQDFRDRPDREQTGFFTALALCETQQAFDVLSEQIQSSGLLGRKRLADTKKNIINGVAAAGTPAAFMFLTGLLESGIKDKDILQTAERARKRLAEKLDGKKPEA